MSEKRKTDFSLNRLDDLFTSQSERENGLTPTIKDIPLEKLVPFPNHPFKVRDDEEMNKLVESVSENGVLVPATPLDRLFYNLETEKPEHIAVKYYKSYHSGSSKTLMFGDLSKYKSKEFYEKHRYIHFDTLVDLGKYEVICVFKTTPSKFDYQNYTVFDSSDEFNLYISKCKENEYFNTDVSCGYGDKLITLSTCEYSQENGRLIVVAKKVK